MDPASPDGASLRAGALSLPPDFDHVRFEIRSTLGRGTSSVVYRAFDHQRGGEVALKVLSVQGSASKLAFKREFRSMADLSHPNLVKLYELFAAGAELMFTMELVDGNDFLGYVRRPVGAVPSWQVGAPRAAAPERATVAEWAGAAPERVPMGIQGELEYFPPLSAEQLPTLRTTCAQLVGGLMALHDTGHVHRDIKPSNVIVDDAGRVVLLDFGVAAELAGHAQTAGTPAYMSPEQALGERPSPSADFYAVGVMLYEALVGQLPYSSDDPVTEKLERDPAPPSSMVADLPEDLDHLCMALLARDPARRPAGRAILDLLCGDTQRTSLPRNRLEIPLRGRDADLRRLESTMREVSSGKGRVVLVTGRSGIGKSALMQPFLARARRNGAVVLTGRCYEQESVPYKALDAVMDAVCQHLAGLSIEEREDLMPRHRWALGRLFPVLAQFGSAPLKVEHASLDHDAQTADVALSEIRQRQTLPVMEPILAPADDAPPPASASSPRSAALRPTDHGVASRSTAVVGAPSVAEPGRPTATDPARIRRQGVTALRQLLEAMARRAPLIIAIDDLQWGDLDSAQVLEEVLGAPQPPFLLLGTYRQEDQDTSEFLRAFLAAQADHEVIALDVLDPKAALELAQSLIHGNTRVSPAEVAQVAKGDPFLLVELARYVSSQEGPELTAQELTVQAVVKARIRQLEAPARRLLEVVAVAAGPLARTVARQAADLGPQESTAMVQLRSANLLRVKGTRGVEVVETYHDRIRDAVREQLDAEQRRAWHLRLVDALQAEAHVDHERLGKHLEAAGRQAEAVPRYLHAAQAAITTLAFDRAADLYRRALAPGLLPLAEEVRVRSEYADVMMRQGRFDEASGELGRCRAKMGPGVDRARIGHRLGEVEHSRGDLQGAIDAFEHALEDLGHPVPRDRRALWKSNLRELAVQAGHSWRLRGPAPTRPATETELLTVRIYNRLTFAYYFSRSGLQVLWPHLRELNTAESRAPTPELGRAYAGHGMMLAALPWFRRGLAYVDRGLELQRRLGDRLGQAQALHQQGMVLYGSSQFREAARVSAQAAEQLEAMDDPAEARAALLLLARAKYRLGHVAEATALARRLHEDALDGGDVFSAASSIMIWTLASGGRVPSMMIRVQVEIASQIEHHFTKLVAMQGAGIRLLGVGRSAEAAAMLDRTAQELQSSALMSTELLAGLDVWRATAWRRVAEDAGMGAQRAHALGRARHALRRGLWSACRFRNSLPHALREAGRLAALGGGMRRARHFLSASLTLAVRHEQAQEAALTRLVEGALFGGAGAAAAASVAEQGIDALAVGMRLHGGAPRGAGL